jgi:putative flavoprotein involved in K+ transport
LSQQKLRFVILDASARIGDVWRKRWDSLRLFSSARYSSLPGMRFPAPGSYFPTKDEMADYLEAYASRFQLPVRSGVRVERVYRGESSFQLETSDGHYSGAQVVIAMSSYQNPKAPVFAGELRPDIVQLHSSAYKNPTQLRPGSVLLAGAGNSGSEIALELARHGHRVIMAGRDTGQVPFRPHTFLAQHVWCRLLLRLMFHYVLTVSNALGRRVRAKVLRLGGPLIRVKEADLRAQRVERAPRVTGVKQGLPVLEDRRLLNVDNVIWCSGYHTASAFVDLPIFDADGEPRHQAGIVADEPGLYFVGLHFLYAMSSSMIHGVGRDAQRIVRALLRRHAERGALPRPSQPSPLELQPSGAS